MRRAFGTVCWEFAANGKELYDDIKIGLMPLMKRIKNGLRLTFPPKTPSKLKAIADRCFDDLPENRPTFARLQMELMDLVQPMMSSVRDVGTLINAPLAQRLRNMSTAVTLHTRRTIGGAKRRTLKARKGRKGAGGNAAAASQAAARSAAAKFAAEKLDTEQAVVRAASADSMSSADAVTAGSPKSKGVGFAVEGESGVGGDGGDGNGHDPDHARYRPVYMAHEHITVEEDEDEEVTPSTIY